jgi:DNA-binding LytR/AlgR family response regulator
MPKALNYCSSKKDLNTIETELENEIAVKTSDEWSIMSFDTIDGYADAFRKNDNIAISYCDITSEKAVEVIGEIRKSDNDAMLVIIADTSVSPLVYMKPTIMASSLLLKPLTNDAVSKCSRELLHVLYKQSNDDYQNASRFCVESKSGKSFFRFDDIYYFEARQKKIFLNTAYSEVGFYSTLDEIIQSLPNNFVRCHRGFIVNSSKITKTVFSQGIIYCGDEIIVPISRSYKAEVMSKLEDSAK